MVIQNFDPLLLSLNDYEMRDHQREHPMMPSYCPTCDFSNHVPKSRGGR